MIGRGTGSSPTRDLKEKAAAKAIMSFSEFEQRRVDLASEAFLAKRRPREEIRDKLDIAVRRDGQSVMVLEIRPQWNDPTKIREIPVAKATYVKTRRLWRIFWMRADLKWHSYPPSPEVRTIEEFFEVVHTDPHVCFWG